MCLGACVIRYFEQLANYMEVVADLTGTPIEELNVRDYKYLRYICSGIDIHSHHIELPYNPFPERLKLQAAAEQSVVQSFPGVAAHRNLYRFQVRIKGMHTMLNATFSHAGHALVFSHLFLT